MKKIIASTLSIACAVAFTSCVVSSAIAEPSPSPSAKSKEATPDTSAPERKQAEEKKTAKAKKDNAEKKNALDPQKGAEPGTPSASDGSKTKDVTKPDSAPATTPEHKQTPPTAGESSKENKAPAN
ncbi:MAG: hypothetical protein ACAI35_26655 [Candidatus Methylacidiphilales bacterium]